MRRQKAFTLVELLVVIAIIGMLVALLLPAVNAVRESGRLVTCKNHARQQALAIRSYAQQFTEDLPALWSKGTNQPWESYSWRVALLPYMEEKSRFNNINQSVLPLDPQNHPVSGVLPVFSCPSAPGAPRVVRNLGSINPGANLGVGATDFVAVFDVRGPLGTQSGAWYGGEAPDTLPSGRLDGQEAGSAPQSAIVNQDQFNAKIRKIPSTLRRIRDGLSNTVLIVEQAGKPDRINQFKDQSEEELPIEGAWITAEFASFFATQVNQDNHSGAFGFHSGATIAMCDGSVHFWPSDIDESVMFALLTREGSEIISDGDW